MGEPIEITVTNPHVSSAKLASIKVDERGAAAIFSMLLKMGVMKNIRLYASDGGIYILRTFKYTAYGRREDGTMGDALKDGTQQYSLDDFVNLLVRYDRKMGARQNKLKSALNKMNIARDTLDEALR